VDLVTYHIGEDVSFPGLRIFRIPKVPGIKRVKIGPSPAKAVLDVFLIGKTLKMLLKGRYDYLHTHEEAGFWGMLFARIFGIPHLYDMHSSLPQQLSNFQFSSSRLLWFIFHKLELRVLRTSASVITICPDLFDHVQEVCPERGSVLVENVIDYGMIFGEEDESARLIRDLGLKGKRVALYTGTFEPYQGLDLLIDAVPAVAREVTNVLFLLVGGNPEQIEQYRMMADKAGVASRMCFCGQVRPNQVESYLRRADVLLSPRTRGTNTPLKIYAYLRSGVPVVATRLHTHTQVLDDSVALLTAPEPEAFAAGIITLIKDRRLSGRLSRSARDLAEKEYSYPAYLRKLKQALLPVQARG